jgi:hypothetical protein
MRMNSQGNGKPLDSGIYSLRGFDFTLAGNGGGYHLRPKCVIWPHMGTDPMNQIALESGDGTISRCMAS